MRSTLIPAEFDASGLPLTAYIEHPRAVICNTTPMRISAATMVRGMIGQPSMVTWPNKAQPSERFVSVLAWVSASSEPCKMTMKNMVWMSDIIFSLVMHRLLKC